VLVKIEKGNFTLEENKIQNKSLYDEYILGSIRNVIRPFFFPFLEAAPVELQRQQEIEKNFFRKFWDPKSPYRPELIHHQKIRDNFTWRKEEVPIKLNGKSLTVTYSVIETEDCNQNDEVYNFIHVLGVTCTVDNDIMSTYPLLATYLEMKERPPARFILISQYETRSEDGSLYKVETLDEEVGKILFNTLKALEKKHGQIHQLLAYSLGCIVTAASLKHFEAIKEVRSEKSSLQGRVTLESQGMPKHITFDRGPSSVTELSKLYTGGFILLPLGKISGWDMDFGKEIAEFIRRFEEKSPSITVINAVKDHRFGNKVNLYESPYIRDLKDQGKISAILLDQPLQCAHQYAHHSTSLKIWNEHHIVEGTEDLLKGGKSLASAILEKSMPKVSKKHTFFSWFGLER